MAYFAGILGKVDRRRDGEVRVSAPYRWGLGVMLCGAALVSARGQATTTLLMPQGPLLPGRFGAWSMAGEPEGPGVAVQARDASVLREDGLLRSSKAHFVGGPAGREMDVTAYEFGDASGAYSAFGFYHNRPSMGPVERLGKQATASTGRSAENADDLLILSGTAVLRVDAAHGARVPPAAEFEPLVAMLPKVGGPRGLPPLLPTYLPNKGLVPGSVRYALGPEGYMAMGWKVQPSLVGFDKAAEVAEANYTERGGKGTVTLFLYPTPQIAGDRGRAIEAYLNSDGTKERSRKLRREGPLVVLASGDFSPEEAEELADGVHLRTDLTWNKQMPLEFHAEVQKTASLLVNIAVLSGVLGLAAVLLGLFLGFGRAWVRVLMGKPAATEPEFLRLNLRSGGSEADGPAVKKPF